MEMMNVHWNSMFSMINTDLIWLPFILTLKAVFWLTHFAFVYIDDNHDPTSQCYHLKGIFNTLFMKIVRFWVMIIITMHDGKNCQDLVPKNPFQEGGFHLGWIGYCLRYQSDHIKQNIMEAHNICPWLEWSRFEYQDLRGGVLFNHLIPCIGLAGWGHASAKWSIPSHRDAGSDSMWYHNKLESICDLESSFSAQNTQNDFSLLTGASLLLLLQQVLEVQYGAILL